MNKIKCLLLLVSLFYHNVSLADNFLDSIIKIIPEPVSLKQKEGIFKFDKTIDILFSDQKLLDIATAFGEELTSFSIQSELRYIKTSKSVKKSRKFILLELVDIDIGDFRSEGYSLEVGHFSILIKANTIHGVFNGIQSLFQILPSSSSNNPITIPCVDIIDYPEFAWRGLMLDVSRHFFSKEFVKSYIDEMSKYKLNILHWHLTDDNGWRIEIEGLPKLTDIGAWRAPRNGIWGALAPQENEVKNYGGYYSKKDLKEIVKYASERFITIVPEIDVPGHSMALIASYPDLSCKKEQFEVNNGSPFNGAQNVLCASNDSVFMILDKIIAEVAEIFPGEYIHMGGDEVNFDYWRSHDECMKLMKSEGIASVEEIQTYFMKKTEEIVMGHNKKMMTWYGSYVHDLNIESATYSWQGIEGGIKSSNENRHVVMTPDWFTYLDYYQGTAVAEPFSIAGGMLRLQNCYELEMLPEGIKREYILGGQGNLWTEGVPTERHAQYMTWPRALALAEVFWSPKTSRSWNRFVKKAESRFRHFDKNEINYSKSLYNPIVRAIPTEDNSYLIHLASEIDDVELYYSFNGTDPDEYSSKFTGDPLIIPWETHQIRVAAFLNGSKIGKQVNLLISELPNTVRR